ncbi:MAG: glycosyltransferase [Verrucomicrobiota bacterium]|nr:glycosyltransferase [Verrucomicrobiota bacterium]
MKKVLILTAAFGEGHNTAARNIRDALELMSEDIKIEILDLFETSYGRLNSIAKKSYLGLVQHAPSVWGGIYSLLDNSPLFEKNLAGMSRLRDALEDILKVTQPDCVVSTYPVYGHVIKEIYKDYSEKPFRFITVVTDSITINSLWYKAPADLFCVPNAPSAEVMVAGGIPKNKVLPVGFPVSPQFLEFGPVDLKSPKFKEPRKILYIINTGKKKAGKVLDELLEIPHTQLTVTVGRDAELKAKITERAEKFQDRVRVIGWTNMMPQLMMEHHLVITKAGGATVQECIAARAPMIINQVIPGQEEGNAKLVEQFGLGAVASKNKEVPALVESAFVEGAAQWGQWRRNMAAFSKPDAAFLIGELILEEENVPSARRKKRLFQSPSASKIEAPSFGQPIRRTLLCDFHIHSNYSDGKLSVPEIVDFYGSHGFDCICLTDHLADPRRLIGKFIELANFTLAPDQLEEYFEVLERERRRAWRKYSMHVLSGIEFNKDGFTKKTSAHLLGVDLKKPINPALDLLETIEQIHAQGGLTIASHPHMMKSEWGKNTLYLWLNQEIFADKIDAWEIANRNNLFTPIGLKNLPFIANSDFHKPKHIYSWKTILHCEKEVEAIKDCVRKNVDLSITLYRDFTRKLTEERPVLDVEQSLSFPAPLLPAAVARVN